MWEEKIEQEYNSLANYYEYEYGTLRHNYVMDCVIDMSKDIGLNLKSNKTNSKGTDAIGDINVEGKSWDKKCKSYKDLRYWRRLIFDQILARFSECVDGLLAITLEIPVYWRDFLRGLGIYPVFIDPEDRYKNNLQRFKMAALQYNSEIRGSVSLQSVLSKGINYIESYDLSIVKAMVEAKEPSEEYILNELYHDQIQSTSFLQWENLG